MMNEHGQSGVLCNPEIVAASDPIEAAEVLRERAPELKLFADAIEAACLALHAVARRLEEEFQR